MSFTQYQPTDFLITAEKSKTNYQDLTDSDIVTVDNGTVAFFDNWAQSGVYDEKGYICPASVLLRGTTEVDSKNHKNFNSLDFIDQDVIYLGGSYFFQHFGHFLMEGINRLWACLVDEYKSKKVVIFLDNDRNLPRFVREVLNAVGVSDDNIITIRKPTRFRRVFVPRQSTDLLLYILPITKKVYGRIADVLGHEKIKTYDKIYLSRGAMNDGRTFGEKSLENIFTKNGYKIIYPETLPLAEQITLVHNCRELAGTAGTALHLAVFMKDGGRVVQIKRNSTKADTITFQKNICDLNNLDLVWVAGSVEKVPTPHYTRAPQIVGVTPYMIKFFDDNGFEYTKSDIAPDVTEFKRYTRQMRKYNAHMAYSKCMNVFIKLISLIGVNKSGRKFVREYLRRILKARY